MNDASLKEKIEIAFSEANISIEDLQIRRYPDETIVIVYVRKSSQSSAIAIANELDSYLSENGFSGFVTIKSSITKDSSCASSNAEFSLQDSRVTDFVNLLVARSRTTETQPSLEYIPDSKDNIATVKAARHHLVFGRRGTGKTALLVETKSQVTAEGARACWLNLQVYRHEEPLRVFLHAATAICDEVQTTFDQEKRTPQVVSLAVRLAEQCRHLLAEETPDTKRIHRLIPDLQKLIRRFGDTTSSPFYVFLDDFHYIKVEHQAYVLDMLHGAVRDCNAWLKIATIQHLSKWWNPAEQVGLQSGHDAQIVNLDITLHAPTAAKGFLEKMLEIYARHCGIVSLNKIYSTHPSALDRLLLASGAVPRDYLTLSSVSVQEAKRRQNAKRVGVQDVNKSAGDAKQRKLDELEEDAAQANQLAVANLQRIRDYCISEKNWTYFRVEFQDKESNTSQYAMLQVLADLRFIHLIEPSLSDEREAGQRSEVYLLDLSQFAGQRLRRKLNLLDLVDGHLVLKRRVGVSQDIVGSTANKRTGLLRRAPVFPLSELTT